MGVERDHPVPFQNRRKVWRKVNPRVGNSQQKLLETVMRDLVVKSSEAIKASHEIRKFVETPPEK